MSYQQDLEPKHTACRHGKNVTTNYPAALEEACAEVDSLRAQLEAARKDSERLDWLENQTGNLGTMHLSQCFSDGIGRMWFTKQIRAAIDAARAQRPAQEGSDKP